MNFDPGEMFDDSFEDGIQDNDYTEDATDGTEFDPELDTEAVGDAVDSGAEVEYDDEGNLIPLVVATSFGYHMASEEIEERKLAEGILKRKEGRQDEPIKVPLARRKEDKGHMTPFARWSTKANLDHKRAEDDIEYTKEEQAQIFKSEGDWDG